ncbi:hypothetical protein BG015_005544 [Linnemannia schmuckeri]|uniref:Uncharacterized protein n=1 Tax=Linnemannia schmuckeri TaxID=64567 RepID=A0A9P5S0L2_9FUNG|nr:hypothetical protein BG015_005544 [Linnemannia schmuckeri]
MDHIGDQGEYDIRKSSIVLRPKDSKGLQRFCLLDTTKVGCITELIIDIDWDAPMRDLESIRALAKSLCFSNLTITITNTTQPHSTHKPPFQSPLLGEFSGSPPNNIQRISRALLGGLKNLSIVSNEALDISAFLRNPQDRPLTEGGLIVTINKPSSMCTVDLYDGNIHLLELEASLADVSRMISTQTLHGNLQSLTITGLDPMLTEEALLARTNKIKAIIHNNLDLSSLILHWSASAFLQAEAIMRSIYTELLVVQTPNPQLPSYTLVDNTKDHLFVTFSLPNSQATKSIVANVTVRNHEPNLGTLLDIYGPFIQILNTNDKLGSTSLNILNDSVRRERSSQLTSVMISLSTLNTESARKLQSTFLLCSATLQQVVLVGSPLDEKIGLAVLNILESPEVNQVVLFDDGRNMETWIAEVSVSLSISSTLTVLDRVEDIRRLVPGHDDTSLDWLKARQTTNISGAISQGPLKGSSVTESPIQSERRIRPSVEYKPFRVLGEEDFTVNIVPITNADFGQVLYDLYSPGDPKSRMILADRDGDPENRKEFYEVAFTLYISGDGDDILP